MLTAMRNALRRLVIVLISVLVIFTAFAAGIGLYVAVLALWPVVLVWWPRLLAGAGAVVALGAWWLWWRLPKRQMRSITAADPKARADIEDNFRKTIGQVLTGLFVLLGAGFGAGIAYYGTFQTLQANEQQARRSQQAANDLLISNQVSKGFEQFGSENIRVRLGGIYALGGVMNSSEQYHQPVLETLITFVRDGTRSERRRTAGSRHPSCAHCDRKA
jgi:hypothetical protein